MWMEVRDLFEVEFYEERNGVEPVREFIISFTDQSSKQ
jgi:hypothetical protein